MLFNSYEFIFIFLPIVFFGYFFLLSKRFSEGAKLWLVAGSLFFYSWWNPIYLPLILISIMINYLLGQRLGLIHNQNFERKLIFSGKVTMYFGVIFNLCLLGYFKYVDFFIGNINSLFLSEISLLEIALPLAISFFTFQQIAYLVDSHHGETKEYSITNYMLFVTFFPQLVAGPIVHHREMMPQFSSRWNLVKRYRNIAIGLFVFTLGLFKKVVLADTFAKWANSGFDIANSLDFFEAWATSLSYTFQIYFDFSGYTDMAIGIALLFNIRLPINFNSPYKAKNIQDFWHRWHITLSRFLRDYIYIPLGGNRTGEYRTYANLGATFLLGGLWHGASWMFVLWGGMHGSALIIHRIWQRSGLVMTSWLGLFITFNFINITWIFFRAQDVSSATKVLRGMTGLNGFVVPSILENKLFFDAENGFRFGGWLYNVSGDIWTPIYIFVALIIVFLSKNSQELARNMTASFAELLFIAVVFFLSFIRLGMPSDFLYFNF
jgi:alginate O-acetyltransferase complex protein AlgI